MSDPPFDLGVLRRQAVPLRVSFLHVPTAGGGAGPLSAFVRQRRAVAFDLLLFAHAMWALVDDELNAIVASSEEWARAIGIEDAPGSRSAISRAWTWLEEQQLIETGRTAGTRARTVRILREDGSGEAWTPAYQLREPYFSLSHYYWWGGFSRELSLAAKAMLLIGLSIESSSNDDFFEFPIERSSQWYGLSEASARKGLQELRSVRLLRTWGERRPSPQSRIGYAIDRRHGLIPLETAARRREFRALPEAVPDPDG